MARFKYVARDAMGSKVENQIEATNQAAAVQTLKRSRLTVLSINPVQKSLSDYLNINLFGGKVKPRVKGNDLVIFTRQFSTMVEAGLPVVEILDILMEQADDKGFKLALSEVRSDVRGGSDLSTALGRFPMVFNRLYVDLIRAGEASGELDVILKRLATYLEKNAALRRKIISAMTYPMVSLGMVLMITIGLLVFIVPQFEDIFAKLGAGLPLPTKIVLAISHALTDNWYIVLGVLVGAIVAIYLSRKSARGRYFWDNVKIKMPIFGELFQKVALARFSRTFATMLRSGVPMLGALEIVATTAGNGVVEEAITASREAVRQGEALATPLADCPVFPPMVVRMIAVGERTGAVETLLEKVADFYDEQVDAAVESLTSVIEPVMIGVLGVFVGGIVIALLLPIFELQRIVSR